jgi:predicted transcriptional regulator
MSIRASRERNCLENAVIEHFRETIKSELFYRKKKSVYLVTEKIHKTICLQ